MAIKGEFDLESGAMLFPGISSHENAFRWGFIRKVYGILSAQVVLTAIVSAIIVLNHPVTLFLTSNPGVFFVLAFLPFIVLCPLFYYRQKHPVNLILLGLFTVTMSFTVGIVCAYTEGTIVLEALILTAAVVVSLTAYTFWAAKKGYEFSYLGPMLFSGLIILLLFGFIQAFFPLGRLSVTIYGALASLIFSAYIIYDTDKLIRQHSYDEYISASIALYLDVINLFLALMDLLRGFEGR